MACLFECAQVRVMSWGSRIKSSLTCSLLGALVLTLTLISIDVLSANRKLFGSEAVPISHRLGGAQRS